MPQTGVLAAAATPWRPELGTIDVAAALDLVDFLNQHHVDGLVLLGSTGEFVHFDAEDRMRLVHLAAKRSRVPIFANISHTTLAGSLRLAEAALGEGVAGVVLMPPYFFPYSQSSLVEYYLRFSDECDGPTYLYNIPFFTSALDPESAGDLLATGRFAGLKDSSGDVDYLSSLLPFAAHGAGIYVGNDRVFRPLRAAGAHGVVSGVACAVPELMVALDRAIAAGDAARAERLDAYVQAFINWLDEFPTPVGVKAATSWRGVAMTGYATPFPTPLAARLRDFENWFRDWWPGVAKDC
jgi:4-hydroxy-tetrahydrodipicolinate synthase